MFNNTKQLIQKRKKIYHLNRTIYTSLFVGVCCCFFFWKFKLFHFHSTLWWSVKFRGINWLYNKLNLLVYHQSSTPQDIDIDPRPCGVRVWIRTGFRLFHCELPHHTEQEHQQVGSRQPRHSGRDARDRRANSRLRRVIKIFANLMDLGCLWNFYDCLELFLTIDC